MPDTRPERVLEVRAALSHALGAAQTALQAARARHEAATERLTRVRQAAAQGRIRLAAERDRRLVEIDHQQHDDLAALAGAAASAAAERAPGAAGAGWAGWAPTPGGPAAPAAELRVGRLLLPYDG